MQINQINVPAGALTPMAPATMARPASQAPAVVAMAAQPAQAAQIARGTAAAQGPSPDELRAAVDEANQEPSIAASNLSFSIDQDLRRVVVKLVDSSTQDVIRQIPSEDFMRISKALQQMQGVFVREQA